jgi:RecA-family ATPase
VATVDFVKPVALFLDTCADVYGGDEIKRSQVRQFIGQLRKLAIEKDVAVILLYHPSQSGIESGKGTSGSTAWANSARAAVYMTRDGRKDDADEDVRKLKTTKSNYGKFGDGLTVRWEKGVFVLDDPHRPPSVEAKAKQVRAEKLFLERLDQHNAPVTRKRLTTLKSGNYAPRLLHKMGACEFSVRDFERAMTNLLAEGKIIAENIRMDGKGVEQLVRNWDGQKRYGDDE